MISEKHQRLVNELAQLLENEKIVRIVAIDIAGTPQYFDQKYRSLPEPSDCDGIIPDLKGVDTNHTVHLGEAETDMEEENLDIQLQRLSNKTMTDTTIPLPLHVIVPQRLRSEMESRIRSIGLGNKLMNGRITVWSGKDYTAEEKFGNKL